MDKYHLNDILRRRRSREAPENKSDIFQIIWLDYKVGKMDRYGKKYFKDEENRLLDKTYNPTLDKRLEINNCAYERTLEFNKETSFRKLKYYLKDTVFADYLKKVEQYGIKD